MDSDRHIEKKHLTKRFAQSIHTYHHASSVQQNIAQKMIQLLKKYTSSRPEKILEIGSGTGFYSRLLTQKYPLAHLTLNDIVTEMELCYTSIMHNNKQFVAGDAEQMAWNSGFDMITSTSVFQWFEAPAIFFQKINSILNPLGILAFSSFGPSNLKEIKTITGEGLRYYTLEEWCQMIKNNFTILHASEEKEVLTFSDPLKVLQHLKETGVNAVAPKHWTRKHLTSFVEQYVERYEQKGKVPLTYHPIYIIAEKK